MIFRDDDIDQNTSVEQLHRIHTLFQQHGVTHTIAVICKDLINNKELVRYLNNTPGYDIQVHCWDHVDLTQLDCLPKHLKMCVKMFNSCGFKRPKMLYPPWNKADARVVMTAAVFGLNVSNDKMSLSGYLKGHIKDVINFHYWAEECKDLEAALVKYKMETIKI